MRDDLQFGSVGGFLLDKENKLLVRMRDNGIYKLAKPLDPVGVKDMTESFDSIKLFPQPVSNWLWFSSKSQLDGFQCRVFNLIGQQVLNPIIENNQIAVSLLTPGIYNLQLCGKNGNCWTGRFVKN
jgi:hypothetical protein